jgi:DNA-binding beta-propeller fold protein YncE
MQDGMRAALVRAARSSGRGLRALSPRALLSLLCAGAFSPLIPAAEAINKDSPAGAGLEIIITLGSHLLSGVIAKAVEDHSAAKRRKASAGNADDLQEEIARQIERALAAGDANARTLLAEIAAVLEQIDAGGVALRAAIEDGNEQLRSDVISAIGMLGADFGELGFLIKDVARAAAEIQRSLDEQGADVRAIIDQDARQSTETRAPTGGPITAGSSGAEGTAIAFSPDGKTLATANGGGTASLWDLATGSRVDGPFTTGPDQTDAVAFSPDGKTLATGGGDGLVRLWDLAIHGEIGAPLPGSGTPFALAFSPDDKTLATMDASGTARLFDVATSAQISALTKTVATSGTSPDAAAFSPDGKILATASDTSLNNGRGVGEAWSLATHRPIGGPLPLGADHTGTVAFSPNGKTLASTSGGNIVQLWDVASHVRIGALVAANGTPALNRVAFSPDGKTLATWGVPGPVRLWDIEPFSS